MRVGSGFDVHAFDPDRPLIIGGVEIPDSPGLAGHSDADAVLGAARLGDLGSMFPDDPRWADASSLTLLRETVEAARAAGWELANIDSTVIAETPKLSPYRSEMIANIASAARLPESAVSVKATTSDGLGFTGRREGIAALAAVLLDAAPPGTS